MRYPGEQYKGDNVVYITDGPALSTQVTKGGAIPAGMQKDAGGGKITISAPSDAALKKVQASAPGFWGKADTVAKYKFETQLIYKDGDTEVIKGTWNWSFTLKFKKGEGDSYLFDPADAKATWEKGK